MNPSKNSEDPEVAPLAFLWLIVAGALFLAFAGNTAVDRRYGGIAAIPLTIGAVFGIVMMKYKKRGQPETLPLSQQWANNARVAVGIIGAILCRIIAVAIAINVAAAKRNAGGQTQAADLLGPLVVALFIGFVAFGPVGWCLGFFFGKEREQRNGGMDDH